MIALVVQFRVVSHEINTKLCLSNDIAYDN